MSRHDREPRYAGEQAAFAAFLHVSPARGMAGG